MMLPHTYFWNIAKSSIMIYNGRIYQLKPATSNRTTNVVKVNGDLYEFEESETLLDLEALYNTDFVAQIDELKTQFLNEKLKDSVSNYSKWKLKSINKIKSNLEENNALLLILEKIIPELEGKNPIDHVKEYADMLPKEEIQKFKEKISEVERVVLDEKIRKVEIKGVLMQESLDVTSNQKDRSILGKFILHNFNIVILSPTKMLVFSTKKSEDRVDINGNTAYLQNYKEYNSIDGIESSYLDLLEHTFNFEALEHVDKTIEELGELYKQEALLNQIIKGEEFHGHEGGFYKHTSGKFVFYVNFPQFINKFPNGDYVMFPSGKIAIGATYDNRKKDFSIMRDSITLLSRYFHPFTQPFDDGDESHFCIGSYTLRQKMPGYEKIPQTLMELKTLLMSGYNSYHRNIENVYKHNYSSRMTLSEAKKKGVPITNEDIVVSDNIKKKYEEPVEES